KLRFGWHADCIGAPYCGNSQCFCGFCGSDWGLSPVLSNLTLAGTLKEHPFTEGMSAAQVEALARLATEVTFEEDEVVLVGGQHSTSFYVVLQGSVVVELSARRYVMCVQSLSAGTVFGWSALLDKQDTLFQVRARERTVALEIDGAA